MASTAADTSSAIASAAPAPRFSFTGVAMSRWNQGSRNRMPIGTSRSPRGASCQKSNPTSAIAQISVPISNAA